MSSSLSLPWIVRSPLAVACTGSPTRAVGSGDGQLYDDSQSALGRFLERDPTALELLGRAAGVPSSYAVQLWLEFSAHLLDERINRGKRECQSEKAGVFTDADFNPGNEHRTLRR